MRHERAHTWLARVCCSDGGRANHAAHPARYVRLLALPSLIPTYISIRQIMRKRPYSRPRSPFASTASTEVPALEAAAACQVPLETATLLRIIQFETLIASTSRRDVAVSPTDILVLGRDTFESPVADRVLLLEVLAIGRVQGFTAGRIIGALAYSHIHVVAAADDCVHAAAPVACYALGVRRLLPSLCT
jgi:hypothetical protein